MIKHAIRFGAGVALVLSAQTEVVFAGPLPMLLNITTPVNANPETAVPSIPVEPAAPVVTAPSRGELLYTMHCISCHTTQMHWRDKPVATNWISLKRQVRRWQDASSLVWNESDITEVSRYLNDSIYHFEQTADPVSLRSPKRPDPVTTPNRLASRRNSSGP
jgi:hypothetical protein